MKLVVVGEFDSDNLGDILIGEGQLRLFSRLAETTLLPLEPDVASRLTHKVSAKTKANPLRRLHRLCYGRSVHYRHAVELLQYLGSHRVYLAQAQQAIVGKDLLVIGGGQLLSDGTLRMLLRVYNLTRAAAYAGIPAVAFGTGVAQPRTIISRHLLGKIIVGLSSTSRFRDRHSISVVDRYTRRIVSCEERLNQIATPDGAIFGLVGSGRFIQRINDRFRVGIAPMSTASLATAGSKSKNVDVWWADAVKEVCRRGYEPILFCSGVAADWYFCQAIQRKLLVDGYEVEIAPRPTSTKEFVDLLATMRCVLCQRLHISITYYCIGGVPMSAGWDRKVAEFYASIGLSSRVLSIDKDNPSRAVDRLFAPSKPIPAPKDLANASMSDAAELLANFGVQYQSELGVA